jgi:inorganic pyrophosphatase
MILFQTHITKKKKIDHVFRTSAKYEVAKGEKYNPIKQDVKDGQLRCAVCYEMLQANLILDHRVLKHSPMPFNYGMLPQTWADPAQRPLDVPFPGLLDCA